MPSGWYSQKLPQNRHLIYDLPSPVLLFSSLWRGPGERTSTWERALPSSSGGSAQGLQRLAAVSAAGSSSLTIQRKYESDIVWCLFPGRLEAQEICGQSINSEIK